MNKPADDAPTHLPETPGPADTEDIAFQGATSARPGPGAPRKSAVRYFGDYVLLGEIARGGMGVVYHALQTSLDREVAIKMIDGGRLAEGAARHRFQTEAEAMAKLDHPNVVTIYEVGEHDGQQYLSMKLVDGPNLAEQAASKPFEPHQSVALLITVARAVQYAHERGVLHRDLKPSNILLDAQGQPHVTDFGIAKLVERTECYTGSGAMLGTPEYMAPEQAAGRTREVTTAADIYSLGAVLYHLLTGQPPFKAGTPLETLNRVVNQQPAFPDSLNPEVDLDLGTICLKCLRKEPMQRYLTAGALALDLQRWLSHRPIEAAPPSVRERGVQWIQRHPMVSALGAAMVFGVALAAAGWMWHRSSMEKLTSRTRPNVPEARMAVVVKPGEPSAPSNATPNVTQFTVSVPRPQATASVTAIPPPPVTPVAPAVQQPAADPVLSLQDLPELPESPPLSVPLATKQIPNGHVKTAPSGQPREIMERKPDGVHIRYLAPSGRLTEEVVQQPNGTTSRTTYRLNGKLHSTVVTTKDGTKVITRFLYDRDGKPRARESIQFDRLGNESSKTVTLSVNGHDIVKNYDRGRYGFVFRPVQATNWPVFASWYDPYWYPPEGGVSAHPFRYSWGWKDHGWYWNYQSYWSADEVYRTPSHWLADWIIASYVTDRYAASVSGAQAHEEARLLRVEAGKAGAAAKPGGDKAEYSEAKAAQLSAEQKAAAADARGAKADTDEKRVRALAGKPGPQATPIDRATKETLREQIEKVIAEGKAMAEQAAKGAKPVIPDLAQAFADPGHLYPVATAISVMSANGDPAGLLTEGDLLKVGPGQEHVLKNSTEHTFVTMRVISSKGEEGEVLAGALVSIPLKSLQEFDGEFRAKLELGLVEADKNQERFRKGSHP